MTKIDMIRSEMFNPVFGKMSFIIRYLREVFRQNPELGYAVAEEEGQDESTGLDSLLIVSQYDWETKHRGHIPSIGVTRGVTVFGAGIQGADASRVVDAGFQRPTTTMDLITVPVVLSCMARKDHEAEALAFMTATSLFDDKSWCHSVGIFGINYPQISNPTPRSLGTEHFVAHVQFQFSTSRQITIKRLGAQIATNIDIKIAE